MKNLKFTVIIAFAFIFLAFIPLTQKNHFSQVEFNQNSDKVFRVFNTQEPNENLLSISSEGILHIGPQLLKEESTADGYYLYVEKGIRTERVKVDIAKTNGWADYVFEEDYDLISLEELESYIHDQGHLPGIPTREQLEEEGLDLAESNKQLLEKVEELSLYILQLNKRLKQLESK
ncbi:MAG: hypothetical protein NXI09_03430 [Bacteroidetes bacterium]|nr:hypothetical protein [Bacteroidota bacterium]